MTALLPQTNQPTPARLTLRQSWRRTEYFTSYSQQLRMLNTRPKQVWVGGLVVVGLLLPFMVEDNFLRMLAVGYVAAIGAIGLNIVTGYAGQVSLGHAFFLGIGAYTAAVVSGDPDGRTIGFGVTFLPVWLLAGGVVAAATGALVAPLATRVRGLYLAMMTVGLVFVGEHVFKQWRDLSGGPEAGRPAATPELFGHNLAESGQLFSGAQTMYLLMLVLLIIFAVAARNLVRSKVGRAFEAIRDRDIAAETAGVDVPRYKLLAFTISSFYAGCCGALLYTVTGHMSPGSFDLMLSIEFIAMVFIGGVATISGSIMGALFVSMLPWVARELSVFIPAISTSPADPFNIFTLQAILYGFLIIVFLIFEPRGMQGIWSRIRKYWKSWPFSY